MRAATSGSGTFETRRRTLRMSGDGGRREVETALLTRSRHLGFERRPSELGGGNSFNTSDVQPCDEQ
jgi:hypothetical protein